MNSKTLIIITSLLGLTGCSGAQTNTNTHEPFPVFDASVPDVEQTVYYQNVSSDANSGISQLGQQDGEFIVALNTNERAPYPGVLFNIPAAARVEVEYRMQQQRCLLDRQADINRISARALADIQLLQTTMIANNRAFNLMLSSRDQDYQQLSNRISTTNPSLVPWLISGGVVLFLGGALLGTLIQ